MQLESIHKLQAMAILIRLWSLFKQTKVLPRKKWALRKLTKAYLPVSQNIPYAITQRNAQQTSV